MLREEKVYKPIGIPASKLEITVIQQDEFEAMRLCDTEGKSQIEAADKMKISRGTIQRLLNSGRQKLIESILKNRGLKINNNL
jgi:predicted DNA-binding protein (UPF0251 family)